jgi:hypothetical protein
MKRLFIIVASAFGLAFSAGAEGQSISAPASYVWERAIDTGKGCFEYQNCADDK